MWELLDDARLRASDLWKGALEIWISGGWAMIAIAVIAPVLFGLGTRVWLRLRRTGFRSVSEETWRSWITHPDERHGPIGELIDAVTSVGSLEQAAGVFEHVRANQTAPFERDLRVMKVCVSAAPLLGLLGTVTGMLSTFGALASGSGGEKTMALVAEGISVALVTTETGLVVALPGLFFQYQLARTHERYKAFLAHLESVCAQTLHRGWSRDRQQRIHRAALEKIVRTLWGKAVASRPQRPENIGA